MNLSSKDRSSLRQAVQDLSKSASKLLDSAEYLNPKVKVSPYDTTKFEARAGGVLVGVYSTEEEANQAEKSREYKRIIKARRRGLITTILQDLARSLDRGY